MKYQLTKKAAQDIEDIYIYSYKEFGKIKADAYLIGMDESFLSLVENPMLGNDVKHLRKGYRKLTYVSHSIFYKSTQDGILIVRVLHASMKSKLHL